LYLIFLYLLPFFLLAVFNALIYREIRVANKIRASLSRYRSELFSPGIDPTLLSPGIDPSFSLQV
jgi:hypothetical protein